MDHPSLANQPLVIPGWIPGCCSEISWAAEVSFGCFFPEIPWDGNEPTPTVQGALAMAFQKFSMGEGNWSRDRVLGLYPFAQGCCG